MEKEEALKKLQKYFGASTKKTSDDALHKARNKALLRLAKENGWKI